MGSPSDEPGWQWRVLIRFLVSENEKLKKRVDALEGKDRSERLQTTALVRRIVAAELSPYQPHDVLPVKAERRPRPRI